MVDDAGGGASLPTTDEPSTRDEPADFGENAPGRVDVPGDEGSVRAILSINSATGNGNDTITSTENLVGSSSGDILRGNRGANRIAGSGGDDAIDRLAGPDLPFGGNGDDFMHGGGGADDRNGTAGIDSQVSCETALNIPSRDRRPRAPGRLPD